jgi:phosphoribosylformimino-5-aminoimidazole carboxamide ribonucleotide (ProFAR) isomerase
VIDEDKWCARVRFAQGVHILDLQSCFGDGVYVLPLIYQCHSKVEIPVQVFKGCPLSAKFAE